MLMFAHRIIAPLLFSAMLTFVPAAGVLAASSSSKSPRIFDRFYRADPSRTRGTGGHGSGLSVAESMVEAHGGAIVMRSIVSQGTEFRIALPA